MTVPGYLYCSHHHLPTLYFFSVTLSTPSTPSTTPISVDSAEKYAQCREIPGGGYGNHYQFYCHPEGNEISGKLLCNPECTQCLVSTDDKKKDGSSDFPLGEMPLNKCIPLGEVEGYFVKFVGECPIQPALSSGGIAAIVLACLLILALINLIAA